MSAEAVSDGMPKSVDLMTEAFKFAKKGNDAKRADEIAAYFSMASYLSSVAVYMHLTEKDGAA